MAIYFPAQTSTVQLVLNPITAAARVWSQEAALAQYPPKFGLDLGDNIIFRASRPRLISRRVPLAQFHLEIPGGAAAEAIIITPTPCSPHPPPAASGDSHKKVLRPRYNSA